MNRDNWLEKCREWKRKWPVPQEQGEKLDNDENGINLYKFYSILNDNSSEFSFANFNASVEKSVAKTSLSEKTDFKAKAIQPDPVQISAIILG